MNFPPPAVTPLGLVRTYWPGIRLADYQEDILDSVRTSVETVVVAGNEVGKDFVAGLIALTFFLWPEAYFSPRYVTEIERTGDPTVRHELRHRRRIVTSSVAEKHLKILWGEIGRFLDSCAVPLTADKGGPLVVNNLQISFAADAHLPLDLRPSYLVGMVAEKPEKMAGHHAPYTLFMADEASGFDQVYYDRAETWAKRRYLFGNPEACENFFKKHFRQGTMAA